jgi:hypothetical protein
VKTRKSRDGLEAPLPAPAMVATVACLALLAPGIGAAGETLTPDELLGHLAGSWILRGTIDGESVTHDVDAHWVLEGNYIQLHEVARETDADGRPAYEAIVYLDWEPDPGEYACLWLDSTAGGGLSAPAGRARPRGTEIPMLFEGSDGSRFHNTFAYEADRDAWTWTLDSEREGRLVPFARVRLERKPEETGVSEEGGAP